MSVQADVMIAQREPDLRPDPLIARAVAMREHLRDEPSATEDPGAFSPETHEMFRSAGFGLGSAPWPDANDRQK
jgi:3-hydroxy-9,10-secoandrosta-1,3,5(10)-triene-9,17-dione monooxygenase